MENQKEIDEALEKYVNLKEEIGKVPSSREFSKVFSKTVLASLFPGGSAFSRIQEMAGDKPNQFSSEKSDLNEILATWGDLARKTLQQYEKLPVSSDWSYYKLRPSISGIKISHNLKWSEIPLLFHKRFADAPEWSDVLSQIYLESHESVKLEEVGSEECYVYLMKDLRNNAHKIGISVNPLMRERTLQSEQPRTELLAVKKYINRKIALALEKALHDIYSHKRKRGEWFDLDSEDVAELCSTLDDRIG
ncbi:MAG: GIY-YIG nuclease family protein [Cyclobacteriaceae bacterium]